MPEITTVSSSSTSKTQIDSNSSSTHVTNGDRAFSDPSLHENIGIGLSSCIPQKLVPIGQLASLLQEKQNANQKFISNPNSSSSSSKIAWNSVIGLGSASSLLVFPDDLNRSTSAPPTEALHISSSPSSYSPTSSTSPVNRGEKGIGPEKPKASVIGAPSSVPAGQFSSYHGVSSATYQQTELTKHPNYAAYYYSRSRLNPRFPPPPYTPGQSWHHMLWNTSTAGPVNTGNWSQVRNPFRSAPFSSSSSTVPSPSTHSANNKEALKDTSNLQIPTDPVTQNIQATLRHLSLDCSADFTEPCEDVKYNFSDETSNLFNSFRRPDFPSTSSSPHPSVFNYNNVDSSEKFKFSQFDDDPINRNTTISRPSNFYSYETMLKAKSNVSSASAVTAAPLELLEEFRTSKGSRRFSLKEILSAVVEFSSDQFGSRFIQQKLESSTLEEKELIFEELLPHTVPLMTDVFGNYVIQKFFELGTLSQRTSLAAKMKGHVVSLSLQMYGCRVVQKALENLPPDAQALLIKELSGSVIKCVKDQNGNHVIQKCIECVPAPLVQFIVDSFQGDVSTLAMHPYGCRVLQRIFEHCDPVQSAPLLKELHGNIDLMVLDQYGNYVVQHVLEHGLPEDKSAIIYRVRGRILELSRHKFASNVVEKSMTHASASDRRMLIEEVLCSGSTMLSLLMKDPFANYVIQRMLDVAEKDQREQLVMKIKPHLAMLKKFTYGKHIITKVERLLSIGL